MIRASVFRPAAVALVGALAGALLAVTCIALGPLPGAWAAGSVTVANESGTATADPDYATNVTVSGSGFQSIKNGFGGVYVLFGWVDDPSGSSWRPSAGGVVGSDYGYVPDSEAKDNAGFQRFVAFPGSDTASAAHAVMGDDGSWTVDMVIPGSTFQAKDRSGKTTEVDCSQKVCGILTIGAHGVKNANNETFTPITFAAPGSGAGAGSAAEAAKTPVGELRVGIASSTVDAGTSIAFTGQGFTPGEQVVATLDNGLVSVGPLAAGAQGEVAGVLPVPYDVRGGTHLVTLTGAASGGIAEAEVAINPPQTAVAGAAGEQLPMWLFVALVSAIALAIAMVAMSLVISVRRSLKQRRELRARAAGVDAGATTVTAAESASAPVPAGSLAPAGSPEASHEAASTTPSDLPDAPTVELSLTGAER